jgi:hypothetical protein
MNETLGWILAIGPLFFAMVAFILFCISGDGSRKTEGGRIAPDGVTKCECEEYCGCGANASSTTWSNCPTVVKRINKETFEFLKGLNEDEKK